MNSFVNSLTAVLDKIDTFVWGPVMLILLVGTGIFLTIRTKALCWRNLPYALKSVLSKEARQKKGDGDVSPFSALTTALAATIGTGNIVGVATAMVSGGPGALVWMWLSAAFGITSKFSECMLAIKYREVNEKGEMSGGPMYTMKKAFKHKKAGAILGWLFALFAVVASFGIGNLTQANSISTALSSTFNIPVTAAGIVITVLALIIIIGGIKNISKVSQVVVPLMAVFYVIAGLIVIFGNISNIPSGVAMIFKMAFSVIINSNFPSKSVMEPFVVPCSITFAPMIGKPSGSTTVPVIFLVFLGACDEEDDLTVNTIILLASFL